MSSSYCKAIFVTLNNLPKSAFERIEGKMTKWKYGYIIANIRGSEKRGLLTVPISDASLVSKIKMDGDITAWDKVKEFGLDGWELVSVAPITENTAEASYTASLLYTFKKQID